MSSLVLFEEEVLMHSRMMIPIRATMARRTIRMSQRSNVFRSPNSRQFSASDIVNIKPLYPTLWGGYSTLPMTSTDRTKLKLRAMRGVMP